MDVVAHSLLPETLILDVPEIDAQHEEIFRRVEWLKLLCLDANGLVDGPADQLLAFLAEHFSTEARIAREAGLDFSEHDRTHSDNLAAIARAIEEVRGGRRNIFSLLRYLEYWFERHIVEEDRPFAVALHDAASAAVRR